MFDKIDAKIVELLQQDGKTTNYTISEKVGLSVTACVNRIKKLEKQGVVSGYHARLDPKSAGLNIHALVLIKVATNTTETAQKFKAAIKKSTHITECYMTSGEIDYVVRLYARDFEHYEELVRNELSTLPGIVSTNSLFLFGDILGHMPIKLQNSE